MHLPNHLRVFFSTLSFKGSLLAKLLEFLSEIGIGISWVFHELEVVSAHSLELRFVIDHAGEDRNSDVDGELPSLQTQTCFSQYHLQELQYKILHKFLLNKCHVVWNLCGEEELCKVRCESQVREPGARMTKK